MTGFAYLESFMMKRLAASILVLAPVLALAAEAPPEWAYPAAPPGFQVPPGGTQPQHLPGSDKAYTEEETRDAFNPPDWYPNEHPQMPDVVAHGKNPEVSACALCHVTMGYGHPESANIAGLPALHRRTAARIPERQPRQHAARPFEQHDPFRQEYDRG